MEKHLMLFFGTKRIFALDEGEARMSDRLLVHALVASVGVLALTLSACKGMPKPSPSGASMGTPSPDPVPVPAPAIATPMHETIFFIEGDASLSPGAIDKLKVWTTSWGTDGTWVLAVPSSPNSYYDLREKRLQVLCSELQKLGVSKIETKLIPREPSGQYDAIYVEKYSK
jgi:hypothetical protein